MSDKLHPLNIDLLLKYILHEEKHGKIFGYYKDLFFVPKKNHNFKLSRYNKIISTPVGVAAGPHTQMSQNIIAAWLFGAKYIELKTVQILDKLNITKPCIDIYDEGYNCEWSQELMIEQSLDEYINAWILIHILKDKLQWEDDFIFNMSVGYDLEGIKSPKVQWFIDNLLDASDFIDQKVNHINKIYPRIKDLYIPKMISNNVTLSTMHGCPPNEIEKIATHLIADKKLHTTIKLNPTLLGADELRVILNEKLKYKIEIPDSAFEHDLKFDEAILIINRLNTLSESLGLSFSVKLTNTLESINKTKTLPQNEKMVYMSGRALHPISINLASKLQKKFNGQLDISFSAGVDAFNISKVISCGLKPVTVCSDLLKPGGYLRLPQYMSELEKAMMGYNSIEEYITQTADVNNLAEAVLKNLSLYADEVVNSPEYYKNFFPYDHIKTKRKLEKFDCIQAPCIDTCAIQQKIPEYLFHTGNKNFSEAYKSILNENPLPNITGMVCDHLCQTKCTRMNIDNSLSIREIKRFIAENESKYFSTLVKPDAKSKVAIIGAGPAGLSAAYFLAIQGFDIEVFEEKAFAGGMISNAIPNFRIKRNLILQDVENIKKLGVKFFFNHKIDKGRFTEIIEYYDFVFLSVGAQKSKRLIIIGENLEGVYDQLTFLSNLMNKEKLDIGKQVAVIGGGNSAIDTARSAKRLVGDGNVTLIYRRTIKEMPADKEEIHELQLEGIEILELTQPEEILKEGKNLSLKCSQMELTEVDIDGRRRPIKIENSEFYLVFDSIIVSIGQDINLDFVDDNFQIKENYSTSIKNLFAGGDLIRGADSLINAIADGKNVAELITATAANQHTYSSHKTDLHKFQQKIGQRTFAKKLPSLPIELRKDFSLVNPLINEDDAVAEAQRCLHCDEICNICVTVCPNLANISYGVTPIQIEFPVFDFDRIDSSGVSFQKFSIEQKYQIINLVDFCNECGNCNTFCPTSEAPYKNKPRFCLSETAFMQENNVYYLETNQIKYKIDDKISSLIHENNIWRFVNDEMEIIFNEQFQFEKYQLKSKLDNFSSYKAAEMYFLYISLKEHYIFKSQNEEVR